MKTCFCTSLRDNDVGGAEPAWACCGYLARLPMGGGASGAACGRPGALELLGHRSFEAVVPRDVHRPHTLKHLSPSTRHPKSNAPRAADRPWLSFLRVPLRCPSRSLTTSEISSAEVPAWSPRHARDEHCFTTLSLASLRAEPGGRRGCGALFTALWPGPQRHRGGHLIPPITRVTRHEWDSSRHKT